MWHVAIARRWTRARRARLLTGVAAASALTFLSLAFVLRRAAGSQLDLAVTTAIQQPNHPAIHAAMVAMSWPGYSPQNWIAVPAAALGFFMAGFRREAFFIMA